MAISEKSRSALYQGLVPIAGEDAVGEMLSYFPARDVEEPVTKEFLNAELAGIRTEIADLRTEVRTGLADLRTESRTGLAGLRTETQTGLADLRTEMHKLANRSLVTLVGVLITAAGVLVTAVGVAISLVR
jgi:hypothetical protein